MILQVAPSAIRRNLERMARHLDQTGQPTAPIRTDATYLDLTRAGLTRDPDRVFRIGQHPLHYARGIFPATSLSHVATIGAPRSGGFIRCYDKRQAASSPARSSARTGEDAATPPPVHHSFPGVSRG